MLKELNLQEMNEVNGGKVTSLAEYCATLSMLFHHNYETWGPAQQDAWTSAYFTHCFDYLQS